MERTALLSLFAGLVAAQSCEIPEEPLPNTITEGFGVLVQNPEFPVIHNRYLNLFESGGGDQHLYLSPIGAYAFDLTLDEGVLERDNLFAVIEGEYLESDNTTKLFMTERGDPRAIFQPVYFCDPETDELEVELQFVERQGSPTGGNVCVRTGAGSGYEFRYSPPENPAYDPARPCMAVSLVVDRSAPPPAPNTTTTSLPPPTATPTPDLFADMTEEGFAFVGCAPEEGPAGDDLPVRTLPDRLLADDSMTNEICVDFCASEGFAFAGSEYGRECWCANAYPETREPGTTVESLAGCNVRCGGDLGQWCGGAGWLSLYAACVEGEPCVNAGFS